ncbi:MAG: DUF4012 domain-containing protein [Halobacteriota archaeon]|jgi:hypothetical protein
MPADGHRFGRYFAISIACLVVLALFFPAFDVLSLAGFVNDKTYLLVLQDNTEIRPTGGLMACIGLLTVHDGNVKDLHFYYANTSWTGDVVKIDSPRSLTQFFKVDRARLYDSNVQYDFASFAPTMLSNVNQLSGQKADGIIAVDFTALEAIMRITGPISASGDVITSRNVVDLTHYYSGLSDSDKAPLTNLLSSLALKIVQIVRGASLPVKLDLLNTVQQLSAERHLFFYVPGDSLTANLAGATAMPSTDFISVIDFNMGSGKADFGVYRSIDYNVQLLANGSAVSNLTVTYNNTCFWRYDVFTTVLVPPGAELLSVTTSAQNLQGPLTTSAANFTALSASVQVPANETGSITYRYTLPHVVGSSGVEERYDLYVQKQAGINAYTFNPDVQLPNGARLLASQNAEANQTSTGDIHLEAVYR